MTEAKGHERNGAWTVARLVQGMEARGDVPATLWIQEGRVEQWSYKDLAHTVQGLAAGLHQAGLAAGEPAAIYATNSPQWIAVALALNLVGALVVPLDDLATDERMQPIIADSKAKWIFTTREHLAVLRRKFGAEALCAYLMEGADDPASGAVSWLSLRAATPARLPELRPDQAACLFYTSGTTGPPKAFVLTNANIGTNVQALAAEGLVGPGDRALVPLPLHHAYPYIVGMLAALQCGMAIVLPQSVSGTHIAQALHAARVTVIIGVPRLYEALLSGLMARVAARGWLAKRLFSLLLALCSWAQKHHGLRLGHWLLRPFRRRIAPELRLLVSGGAKLEADLSWTLEALGWETLAGYGLAETGSVFTGNLPRRKRLGSAGTPIADGEVRISNPDDGGIGDIELRGTNVTGGYRNDPEANRTAFTGDGWFRTGDLGYLDEDGFLFVTGRAKEVIVLGGGKKVNPEDLESIYAAHPLIGEIALLEHGGQLVALVRPNPERLREIGTLNVTHAVRVALEEVAKRLPAYERVAGFAIAARPLPRTRLGKYRRFLLPDLYDQLRSGVAPPEPVERSMEDRRLLASPVAAATWDIVSRRYAAKHPTLDAHLALDLGVDSLEWMSLSLELEAKLGIALLDEEMAAIGTIRDLITAVIRASARPAAAGVTRQQRMLADREYWLGPIGPALTLIGLFLFGFNKILMRLLFRIRARGLEHLPATGPLLLVANHASDLDPLALAATLPFRRWRQVYWAGDVVRLFGNPVLRLLCRAVHLYPVDERVPASAIETASCVLSRGDVQVWFPEGWRSPDGRLQHFLPGVGTLVAKTRAPAIPVYISGTFRAMPRTRRWPKLRAIRVVIGSLLDAETLEARGSGKSVEEKVTNALQAEVRALAMAIGEEV